MQHETKTFAQMDKSVDKKCARNVDMMSSLLKEAFSSYLIGSKKYIWKASTKMRGMLKRG